MNQNNTKLIVGNNGAEVHIYEFIGNLFVLQQSILTGVPVSYLEMNDNNFVIAGYSRDIKFYKYNGSQYILDQVVTTSSFTIYELGISFDFQTFAFGGTNKKFAIYTKVNNTYEKVYEYHLGSTVKSTKTDKDGLYYIVNDGTPQLYTFYRCPEECLTCDFPSNCFTCIPGYFLKSGACILL